ncbi:glycosyltransferase [Entomomonas sp. E2T0]|uniref:glycosyltransferase n=1 Tax=Entomomonas sp. E2T0 TaxID=2930213 RepID=UPI002228426F|nr:glycosyltransferase [Entomomonas sp. E2T0]UYZ85146.1 glycosyltransferase [Entomomonas sp. E2T0]
MKHRNALNIIIILLITAFFTGLWAIYNRPVSAPNWPQQVSGYSFSPFHEYEDPATGDYPTEEEISSDLALVATQTNNIRTYSVKESLGTIPRLADNYGLKVTLGVWISNDLAENQRELDKAIEIANENRNVIRLVIGNEALFREEVTVDQMIDYLDYARDSVKVPVTTSEQWHIWDKYPELGDHVDLIAAHILPYWEHIPVKKAIPFVFEKVALLKKDYPNKPLILSEIGWPSNGRMEGQASASQADQAIYLRNLVNILNQQGYSYFIVEAFDQPWKMTDEGAVGAYWGVYDLDRQPKFEFTGPVIAIAQWKILAVISAMLAFLSISILMIDSSALKQKGRIFLTIIAFACASTIVWIGYDYTQQYSTWFNLIVGTLLAFGVLGIAIVILTEAHELAETVWIKQRRRPFSPVTGDSTYHPKVCIQVPCYNEPPEMLKQTLDALAKLDYQNYEVMVIDNNTKDPAIWKPVEAYCKELGSRFHFYHVSPLAGFKAGALNYALERVSADVEVIAVIDADYCVDPNWLKHMTPHFKDPKITIVQSPQDYYDENDSLFKKLCYAEYKGFFHIGMITRNERDAIIEHGTMTMVRRTVLDELKWADWCITEDAELGLRVFEKGLSAAYCEQSYGKGLMPDTFIDFKKQRFRWAYGAIQIIKRHFKTLVFGKTKDGKRLSKGQRYHFIAGWLPWIADSMNIFFILGSLLWSAAMIISPQQFDPPLIIFALPPLALFFFKVGKIIFLYKKVIGVSYKDAFFAALTGLSLSHTIAKAVIYGFFTKHIPFFRTPKMRSNHGFLVAFAEAREEVFIMLLLWIAVAGILLTQQSMAYDILLWIITLSVQSLPYLAAMVMAMVSSLKPNKQPVMSVIKSH